LGWIGALAPRLPPSISLARLAITSLTFMLVWVPEPVCHTDSGNSSSHLPSMISCAARMIALARPASSEPSSRLACAAANLTMASAWTTASGIRSVPMRKLLRERSVCAPQ
jgi:hypothetical protein